MRGLSSPALTARGLTVRYGRRCVLSGVSTVLHRGEMVALIGSNGAGKTTFLRAVAGLLPYEGAVDFGATPSGSRVEVAYVPQQLGFDPTFPITAGRLVAAGRRRFVGPWRRLTARDRAAVLEALETVGLPDVARRPIGELSGGQLQRVVLARAMAQEADLLLLDEPLSGVDGPTGSDLLDLLADQCARGRTVLLSTHDLALVRSRFDRCLGLNQTLIADCSGAQALAPDSLDAIFASRNPGTGAAVGVAG